MPERTTYTSIMAVYGSSAELEAGITKRQLTALSSLFRTAREIWVKGLTEWGWIRYVDKAVNEVLLRRASLRGIDGSREPGKKNSLEVSITHIPVKANEA